MKDDQAIIWLRGNNERAEHLAEEEAQELLIDQIEAMILKRRPLVEIAKTCDISLAMLATQLSKLRLRWREKYGHEQTREELSASINVLVQTAWQIIENEKSSNDTKLKAIDSIVKAFTLHARISGLIMDREVAPKNDEQLKLILERLQSGERTTVKIIEGEIIANAGN